MSDSTMHQDQHQDLDPAAPLSEQAAFWCVLLNDGEATGADRRAFSEWVSRSPERVKAYLTAARLAGVLRSPQLRWPETSVAQLIDEARASQNSVSLLRDIATPAAVLATSPVASDGGGSRGVHWIRLAAAASVVLCLAAGVAWHLAGRSPQFATVLGEQRSVVLDDGSIVTLNTSSRIDVQMTPDHRVVRLLAGEALFEVAHDAERPFDVVAGPATVRAVGTQFNVNRHDEKTTVTVVEGKVAVYTGQVPSVDLHPPRRSLTAGEQITLAPRARLAPVRADVATAIAWTQRKLVFERRPLGDVAEEFNRYNHQVIEIRSDALRGEPVTGVFEANDPASFLDFLSGLPGVKVEATGDRSRFIVTQDDSETFL